MPDATDNLAGKFVYASLVCTFRHGREEDEVMGLSFTKELVVDRIQVFPATDPGKLTKLQQRLMQKLGDSAKPFALNFPKTAPNSVLINGEEGDASNMGVSYEVRLHVAENSEDYRGQKKSTVSMSIRKVFVIVYSTILAVLVRFIDIKSGSSFCLCYRTLTWLRKPNLI